MKGLQITILVFSIFILILIGLVTWSIIIAYDNNNTNTNNINNVDNNSLVNVTSSGDLSGVLESSKVYIIHGIIDMGTQSIEVPANGLQMQGYGFDISKLISSEPGFTLFTSPFNGSGNLLLQDMAIEITGNTSQVFDLVSVSGFEAIEMTRVNFNDCSSLGTIHDYRQGLESGTGRFGGSPTLTLDGAWIGGYFIDSSIVRVLSPSMTTPVYSAGPSFTMASRFRSNQNVDLPTIPAFVDFKPSNFINPSTLQLHECIISRNGVFDANDTTLIPNITAADLESEWIGNNGIENTFVGGNNEVTVSAGTTVAVAGTFYPIAGTWTTTQLQHFDSPADGQLRHLGNQPSDYTLVANIIADAKVNDATSIRIRKYIASTTSFTTLYTQTRQVNNLIGGRDLAFFNITFNVKLDQNDIVFLEITNEDAIDNMIVQTTSFFNVSAR